jgi:hypothetical protein
VNLLKEAKVYISWDDKNQPKVYILFDACYSAKLDSIFFVEIIQEWF